MHWRWFCWAYLAGALLGSSANAEHYGPLSRISERSIFCLFAYLNVWVSRARILAVKCVVQNTLPLLTGIVVVMLL